MARIIGFSVAFVGAVLIGIFILFAVGATIDSLAQLKEETGAALHR